MSELQDPYFNFINTIKSPATKASYQYNIKLFMKYCKVKDIQDLLTIDTPQQYIINYIMSLREKGLSWSSVSNALTAIYHFYAMNDITLNKKKINMFKGQFSRSVIDRAYTHQEIKKILDVSDLRMKVIVLLMASTGCRVASIPSLRLRNLEKVDSHNLYKLTVYEGSNESYYCFTSPECASFIDAYLQYREKNGERLDKDSFLIRDQFDITDIEQIRNKSRGIALNTLRGIMGNHSSKSRFKDSGPRIKI
jgi:site-specific recombinase XerD